MSFTFFDSAFIDYREALTIHLYRQMFHAEHDNLSFIGLSSRTPLPLPSRGHENRVDYARFRRELLRELAQATWMLGGRR